MLKVLFKDRYLLLLIFVSLLIRLFALNSFWVEHYYTFGFYPLVTKALRGLFGWVPFSVGDVVYILALVWVIRKTWKLILLLKRKKARAQFTWVLFRKYLKLSLLAYIIFMLFWGLNYYRQGIPAQLGLEVKEYSVQDLFDLTIVLQHRLNGYAEKVDSLQRLQLDNTSFLTQKGQEAYRFAATQSFTVPQYPFLAYSHSSIKPSLFTPVGHFFGFTGYYNPFSAEAQIKTDIPVFLKPFVVTHEMAHQLGYAKENEASFVAYLACKSSTDANFLYSAYFELYRDAIIECRQTPNKELNKRIQSNVHPRIRYDTHDLQAYLLRSQNFIEPFMGGVYDRYLKLNNQPKGKATYDEVIAYMVAYMKKFGKAAI